MISPGAKPNLGQVQQVNNDENVKKVIAMLGGTVVGLERIKLQEIEDEETSE